MMRKLFVALLVGAVAVGTAAPAFAADLKFTGAYRVRFMADDNLNCFGDVTVSADCSGHVFQLRFRPRFEVETEGGVRGVLYFEIGDVNFGNTLAAGRGAGGGADADGVNVETKHAYIDFPVPATPLRLRAGISQFILSKALILDTDSPGLSLYGKLGEINTNLFWFRWNVATPVGADGENARDAYGIDVAFSPTRDLSLNGYFVYTHDMETVATEALTGTWFGVAAAGRAQNIRYGLDFIYGSVDTSATTDQSGFLLFGNVGMAVPGTPLDVEVVGWYATGDDSPTVGDSDAFPIIFGAGPDTGAQIWSGAPVVDISDPADSLQNTWAIGVVARYTATPALRLTGNIHYIGTQEEGTLADPSPAGNGNISGVDSIGTEFGIRADYTLYRGLVFTLTASHLLLGDDTSVDGSTFDDVTKVAGVLNYGF